MSILVLLLPLRSPPVAATAPEAADTSFGDSTLMSRLESTLDSTALPWIWSPDGVHPTRQGRSTPAGWPKADTVVAVAPPAALAWHRPVLPKAPPARLRAALAGVLEDQLLLDDEASLHLALAPGAQVGQPSWVVALRKPWLKGWLDHLAAAGFEPDRVVPAAAPTSVPGSPSPDGGDPGQPSVVLHREIDLDTPGADHALIEQPWVPSRQDPEDFTSSFSMSTIADTVGDDAALAEQQAGAWATWVDDGRALALPLGGGLALPWLQGAVTEGARLSTTPLTARLAERLAAGWPERPPVTMVDDAARALAAAAQPWTLAQFDLAPTRGGARTLGELWHRVKSPAWRPLRWGLAALALIHVVGLNAHAWQQRRALAAERQAQTTLLRQAFPNVRAILDAPAQMEREAAMARSAAGVPGPDDLEPLWGALAAAWPAGAAPATQWRYIDGRLSWPATGWQPPQVDALRSRLESSGLRLNAAEGRLEVQAAAPAAPTVPGAR